jgi:DNA mismatch endonuclease (patch repair protein)
VFRARHKVIFVHGCFWHGHSCGAAALPRSNRPYWEAKQQRNRSRDLGNVRHLRRAGWGVLVLWECQIRDLVKLRDRICRFLTSER